MWTTFDENLMVPWGNSSARVSNSTFLCTHLDSYSLIKTIKHVFFFCEEQKKKEGRNILGFWKEHFFRRISWGDVSHHPPACCIKDKELSSYRVDMKDNSVMMKPYPWRRSWRWRICWETPRASIAFQALNQVVNANPVALSLSEDSSTMLLIPSLWESWRHHFY